MGNRAVITFDKNPTAKSVGIYLHWNGGPESVLAFMQAADELGVRKGDFGSGNSTYELARIAQIIGNWFGGTCSVGIGTLDHLDCDNYDNGIYRVRRGEGEPEIDRCKRPTKTGDEVAFGKLVWERLDNAEVRKDPYWTGDDPILASVIAKNPMFAEKVVA